MSVAERIPAIAAQLRRLLPRGLAWNFVAGSVADKLLNGLALPGAYVEELSARMIEEADPRTTVEWLPDFERVYGLPDCSSTSTSLVARRAAVVARINAPIGQTVLALEQVVGAFGLQVQVEQHKLSLIDEAEIGDYLSDEPWVHTLSIHLPDPPVVLFEADWSGAGDPLVDDARDALECALRSVAPAHAVLQFLYDLRVEPNYQPWDPWEANVLSATAAPAVPMPTLEY